MMKEQSSFPQLQPGSPHALEEEPVLFDGMKVLFDDRVALYPVKLTKVEPGDRGRGVGSREHRNGHDGFYRSNGRSNGTGY